jgi:hypothetical protein
VNPRTLVGSVVAIALVLPVTSQAQAAAESALTHALSSSSTVKAGSALNHALNQSTTQLGIRIQERTSNPVRLGAPQQVQVLPRTAMKSTITRSTPPALDGISVKGGEPACASVSPRNPASPANPSPAKSGPGMPPATVDCHENKSAPNSGTGDKYKSFVSLPFPK